MTTQLEAPVFPKGADSWTKEQANALLRLVEDMFHRRDLAVLSLGSTEDCIVRFSEQPEQRGRGHALRERDRATSRGALGGP